uniref:Serine hydroxymethyltransferase-like domain-containing protein n=1 Tax=Quercus lobata TaxID=97700 RepID=A0A7N2MDS1_QUELO
MQWILVQLLQRESTAMIAVMIIWDGGILPIRVGIDGARVEQILDFASITLNKKSVPGDKSALVPGGIRIGSPAMTTRGFTEKEFVPTTDFIHEGVQITLEAKRLVSGSKLQDFLKFVAAADFPLLDNMLNMLNLFSINNICLFGRMHD